MRRVRVVGALVARGETYLVQQRPAGKSSGLLWEFPGGKVEPGESDEEALARECVEELGVHVQVGARLWSTAHEYAERSIEFFLYRVFMPEDADPKPYEAAQLRWVHRSALEALPFCEADRPLLPLLASGEVG